MQKTGLLHNAGLQMPGIFLFLAAGLLLASNALSDVSDRSAFKCLGDYVSIIQTNEVLDIQGVDIQIAGNGKKYLLGLGVSIINQDLPKPQALLNARKIAELKAKQSASEFLKSDIHTETKLEESATSTTIVDNGNIKKAVELRKKRDELIIQRSEIVLSGTQTVATWFNQNNTQFYVVVAILVEPRRSNIQSQEKE